jgi:hypothetical protein
MTATTSLTEADLRQFTGSECWHRHGLVRDILFTDGAKYLADEAGAYWLLDEIGHCSTVLWKLLKPLIYKELSRTSNLP